MSVAQVKPEFKPEMKEVFQFNIPATTANNTNSFPHSSPKPASPPSSSSSHLTIKIKQKMPLKIEAVFSHHRLSRFTKFLPDRFENQFVAFIRQQCVSFVNQTLPGWTPEEQELVCLRLAPFDKLGVSDLTNIIGFVGRQHILKGTNRVSRLLHKHSMYYLQSCPPIVINIERGRNLGLPARWVDHNHFHLKSNYTFSKLNIKMWLQPQKFVLAQRFVVRCCTALLKGPRNLDILSQVIESIEPHCKDESLIEQFRDMIREEIVERGELRMEVLKFLFNEMSKIDGKCTLVTNKDLRMCLNECLRHHVHERNVMMVQNLFECTFVNKFLSKEDANSACLDCLQTVDWTMDSCNALMSLIQFLQVGIEGIKFHVYMSLISVDLQNRLKPYECEALNAFMMKMNCRDVVNGWVDEKGGKFRPVLAHVFERYHESKWQDISGRPLQYVSLLIQHFGANLSAIDFMTKSHVNAILAGMKSTKFKKSVRQVAGLL